MNLFKKIENISLELKKFKFKLVYKIIVKSLKKKMNV